MNANRTPFPRRTFVIGSTAFALAACLEPASAFADTAAKKQAEAAAAKQSLDAMQNTLDAASNDYYAALDEQDQAQKRMDDAQMRIDAETAKIEGYQAQLGTRAKSMYRTGSNTFLDVLLGSASFEEFSTSWDLLNSLNEQDAQLVENTKEAREQLQAAKDEYTRQKQVADQKTEEARRIKEEAEATAAQMQTVYENLSAEAAQLLEQEKAAAEAAAAAAAAEAAAASQGSGGSGNFNASDYNGNVGATVVAAAQSRLGCPYVWGAKGPNTFDCSGLVAWCYAQAGVSVPSYTGSLIGLPQVSNPQAGDIAVVHNSAHQHTGIYVGGGTMIHAPQTGDVVKYGAVQSGMIYVRPNY